ncbi:MAG TPA: alpha/beta fold hydrolase [Actinomycetota bacterium]|nr:alpha/beta fold hydrolase [Actinomycetota bacterium]
MRRLAAASLALWLAGCGAAPAVESRTIRFPAEDGAQLVGDLRGVGPAGVVLAHMYPEDRASWEGFAEVLAGEGFRVLSFDFRGFGDSDGPRDIPEAWADVLAAAEELRRRGARRVVVVGASMGGTAALVAASRSDLDGVVTLSAPSTFMGITASEDVVAAIDEPKLFVAAEGDGQAALTAQRFYVQAPGAKRVEIVTGDEHGTELLDGRQSQVVRMTVLSFVRTNAQA